LTSLTISEIRFLKARQSHTSAERDSNPQPITIPEIGESCRNVDMVWFKRNGLRPNPL